jgi:hypothetical protein
VSNAFSSDSTFRIPVRRREDLSVYQSVLFPDSEMGVGVFVLLVVVFVVIIV